MSGKRKRSSAGGSGSTTPVGGLRVTLDSTIDEAAWAGLLQSDPRSHLFQRPAWVRRYAHHHGARAVWLQAQDPARGLVAGMPLVRVQRGGWVALSSGAGGTYGGPVAAPDAAAAERAVLEQFARVGRMRVLRRELVWGDRQPPRGAPPEMRPIESAHLDLASGFEHFWAQTFPKNRRNECNRSERRGLGVETTRDPRAVGEFAPLYAAAADRWGVRPEPTALLAEVLTQEPDAVLFVARRAGQLLGAHLCLVLRDELFAWVGTTTRADDVFPSALLIKAEAQFAAAHGLRALNLGSSLQLEGVAAYKRLLGAGAAQRWLWVREAPLLRALRALARRSRRARTP